MISPQRTSSQLGSRLRAGGARCALDVSGGRDAHQGAQPAYLPDVHYVVVPAAGLEPARPLSLRILSPLCLPFHHAGTAANIGKMLGV